ncbi:MAG: preprotein translocase subunit YajC [Deltaproteobacteria bacterium]|nr:preprotein translocase subunit YajC [Deltaproteobacteria bacterium]
MGGGYQSIIFLVLMFAVFYFLLIRPQQKKQKEHQTMIDALKIGDRVLTQGGILGRITGFSDPFVVLEVQEKVRIKVLRSALSGKHSMGSDKK